MFALTSLIVQFMDLFCFTVENKYATYEQRVASLI